MSLYNVLEENFLLTADSYKIPHQVELPEQVEFMYSAVVPRKGSDYTDEIVAMGATLLSQQLAKVRITIDMIDEAEAEANGYGYDFDREGWEEIAIQLDKAAKKYYSVRNLNSEK